MVNDRLLGVGVKEAKMEIFGGMMPNDDTYRHGNLAKAYNLGRNLKNRDCLSGADGVKIAVYRKGRA
jgi:hypothetical protein